MIQSRCQIAIYLVASRCAFPLLWFYRLSITDRAIDRCRRTSGTLAGRGTVDCDGFRLFLNKESPARCGEEVGAEAYAKAEAEDEDVHAAFQTPSESEIDRDCKAKLFGNAFCCNVHHCSQDKFTTTAADIDRGRSQAVRRHAA